MNKVRGHRSEFLNFSQKAQKAQIFVFPCDIFSVISVISVRDYYSHRDFRVTFHETHACLPLASRRRNIGHSAFAALPAAVRWCGKQIGLRGKTNRIAEQNQLNCTAKSIILQSETI